MKRNKEFANRLHALTPKFAYVPQEDRFLMDPGPLKYRFNVIGVGVNGQEHIRVTLLDGRCTVHGVYDPNPSSVEGASGSRPSSPTSLWWCMRASRPPATTRR